VDINLTLFGQSFAMIVFVWFCMKFIWPPLLAALEDRQQQIEEGLAAADKGKESLVKAAAEADEICFSGGLFAPSYADEARAALDCFCEAARTCTPRHGRAYFGGAATEILMDYFVAPTAEGSCTVEVLTGDYPYFWEDGDLVMHEGCAELSCVEDEGGHLRGALTECEPRETP